MLLQFRFLLSLLMEISGVAFCRSFNGFLGEHPKLFYMSFDNDTIRKELV